MTRVGGARPWLALDTRPGHSSLLSGPAASIDELLRLCSHAARQPGRPAVFFSALESHQPIDLRSRIASYHPTDASRASADPPPPAHAAAAPAAPPAPAEWYETPEQLLRKLLACYWSLWECGGGVIAEGRLLDLIRRVHCFGVSSRTAA